MAIGRGPLDSKTSEYHGEFISGDFSMRHTSSTTIFTLVRGLIGSLVLINAASSAPPENPGVISGDASGANRQESSHTNRVEPAPAFNFFAQYGDLNQVYDPTVGSADRMSSYPGDWCENDSVFNGTQLRDTDMPAENLSGLAHYRLSGYPAFDPESVEWAVLRWDVLYEPGVAESSGYKQERIDFREFTPCRVFGGFNYTAGLRERLESAGQNRRQWISLTLDLRSGWIDAAEIDPQGNPVANRHYSQIAISQDLRDPLEPRYPAELCERVLRAASKGRLQGGLCWGGKVSFASIAGRARPPHAVRALVIERCELISGHADAGSWHELSEFDERSWAIRAADRRSAWAVEFDLLLKVPGMVAEKGQSPAETAELEFASNATTATVGKYSVSIEVPSLAELGHTGDTKWPRQFETLLFGDFARASNGPVKRSMQLREFRRFVDREGFVRVRFTYENKARAFVTKVVEELLEAVVPLVRIDLLRITVRGPRPADQAP